MNATPRARLALTLLALAAVLLPAVLSHAQSTNPLFRPHRRAQPAPDTTTLDSASLAKLHEQRAERDSVVTAASKHPDFSLYQSLLDEFLVVTSKKGEPLDTKFDYEKLYDAKQRRARMVLIGDQLMTPTPSKMSDQARLAWAINVYNFQVINVITDNLLVPGRKRLRYKSVQEIRINGTPMFQAEVMAVEGKNYSLDGFERAFIFGGYQPVVGTPTPPGLDPRPHFALVCGANGCPPLQPRAFRPESLDIQLDSATRNALRLPRMLRINKELKLLEAGAIFNWYAGDFNWHDRSIEFIRKYGPSALLGEVKKMNLTKVGAYIDWDWMLNQVEHKKPDQS